MGWQMQGSTRDESHAIGGGVSIRTAAGLAVALLILAACAGDTDSTVAQTQSSVTSQSTTSSEPIAVEDQATVTTTLLPTSPTTTTTTVAEPKLVVIAAGDGVYRNEQPLGPVYGDVKPEAVVTVDGALADVSFLGDTVFGDGMWRWHLGDDITLEEGASDVVFEATFADGSTLRETRTYHFDPSLQRSTGYLLELTLGIPPSVVVEFAPLEYGEFGLGQVSGDTEVAEIPIAADAVFVVLGGFAEDQVLDLEGFAQLAAISVSEEPLPNLWWATIFPAADRDGSWKAVPWEFLVTSDGELRQAAQLYSP